MPARSLATRGGAQPPATALLQEIGALLRELHPGAKRLPPISLDSNLERDLGLDSLTRMELLARVERRLRLTVSDQAAAEARTPGELLRAFAGAIPRESLAAAATRAETDAADALEPPRDAKTLVEALSWHAHRHAAQASVRFVGGEGDGAALTYGALDDAALRVAAGLQAQRLGAAEPVALMFPTGPDLLAAFFGVLLAGGVPVPLYPPLRTGEFADYWRRQSGILRNCGARRLIVAEPLFARRRLLGALAGGVRRIESVARLSAIAHPLEPVAASGSDLAMLQYTSGSTADPKGVMLSHENLLANIRAMGHAIDVSPQDRFVSWLPLYHDMGLIGAWLGTLYFGIPLILMPPQSFLLRPERWLWAIHRHRATLSAAPNFAYELCLHRLADADVAGLDLGSLRLCFSGAEPVEPATMRRFADRFARFGFRRDALFPVYGLAENALALTFPPLGRAPKTLAVARERFLRDGVAAPAADAPALEFVSCGLPLPGNEVRVVDEADRELPDGRQGVVQFRGPSATRGYFANDAQTRTLMHGDWRDTGDLGFVDGGELYLTGRVKDLIIRAGRHLHPQGIEQAVADVDGVRRGRVAAFGARREGTERLIVVAETRLDPARHEPLRAAINAAVQRVAGEPADEVVLAAPGSVLKTSSGKLRRAACRDAYESGRLGAKRGRAVVRVVARSLVEHARARARRAGELAYAGWAWAMFAVMCVPAIVAVALLPTPSARWRALRGVLGALRAATGVPIAARFEAPLPDRPCVLVCNHASYIDAFVLTRVLPRPVAFVAKAELAANPLLRWGLPRIGAVFVERFDAAHSTEVVAAARAGRGDFLFFPEGTFRRTPGLLPFHLGAFVAAAEGRLPVVPIALRGTRSVLRDVEWFPRRAPIAVVVGAPIEPRANENLFREALRLSQVARRFCAAHAGEIDMADARLGDWAVPASPRV